MQVNTVLIADDDFDDIELLREAILEYQPEIEVNYVRNGVQLMVYLNHQPLPDILILDLNMPCKEGQECLAEIRADEKLRHLFVVIYSTTTTTSIRKECIALGANYFVTKPTELSELMKFGEAIAEGEFDLV